MLCGALVVLASDGVTFAPFTTVASSFTGAGAGPDASGRVVAPVPARVALAAESGIAIFAPSMRVAVPPPASLVEPASLTWLVPVLASAVFVVAGFPSPGAATFAPATTSATLAAFVLVAWSLTCGATSFDTPLAANSSPFTGPA